MILKIIPCQTDRLSQTTTAINQKNGQTITVFAAFFDRSEKPCFFFKFQKTNSPCPLFLSNELRQAKDVNNLIRL
jgi:hypothetical protein